MEGAEGLDRTDEEKREGHLEAGVLPYVCLLPFLFLASPDSRIVLQNFWNVVQGLEDCRRTERVYVAVMPLSPKHLRRGDVFWGGISKKRFLTAGLNMAPLREAKMLALIARPPPKATEM